LARLFLKKNEEHRIKEGHLWVFSNEVHRIDGDVVNGDVIEICDFGKHSLGFGFYNKNSLIAVRLLAPSFSGDVRAYINKALSRAYELRRSVYPHRESFRLVFSESDFLPGLIIDKYNDTYVLQVYSMGMQMNIGSVVDVLRNEFKAKNIFTKNEPYFRKLEGLPDSDEVYYGEEDEEMIDDGKISYKINFSNTQKTGFYFDQYDNREYIEQFVKGKNVLDAFCNAGGFGLHALIAGALKVTFVDSSGSEVRNSEDNSKLNNLYNGCEFVTSDVFDFLEDCMRYNRKFDMVILDPPAFAKSRKSIPSAIKGYIKLNKLALQCISENGFLVTSSCSHHVDRENFLSAVNAASVKSNKRLQLIHIGGASKDHPILPAMIETSYLKFAVFRIY